MKLELIALKFYFLCLMLAAFVALPLMAYAPTKQVASGAPVKIWRDRDKGILDVFTADVGPGMAYHIYKKGM